jgi:hypothetical protein
MKEKQIRDANRQIQNKWFKLLPIILLLPAVFFLGRTSTPAYSKTDEENFIWTHWNADHYALVEDGETLWIGSGSGLIAWHKGDGTHTRISTVEGLPHRQVYSGAVDTEGNRWFGGDAGLSKLSSGGDWTIYNTVNSGIFSNHVESVVATGDGTLWLGHGAMGYVSRLASDGTWTLYPNRQAAVSQQYASIKQSLNVNDLWTVSGDEVWVDYDVYDGSSWQPRHPDGSGSDPLVTAAGSGGKLWALETWSVYYWDGDKWWEYPFWYDLDGELTSLAVDENDVVWVGGTNVPDPYSGQWVGLMRLPQKPGGFWFEDYIPAPAPINQLMTSGEDLWGIGPNWLLKADGDVKFFRDTPAYTNVYDVVADQDGRLWVVSGSYDYNGLQTLDDQGTATIRDDQWQVRGTEPIITALEPAPDGDLWMGWKYFFKFMFAGLPTRFHGQKKIEYYPPFEFGFIDDIFIADDERIYFSYTLEEFSDSPGARGIWSLDDGGTAADFDDDVWEDYPFDRESYGPSHVAVLDGQLYYGDYNGVYILQAGEWKQLTNSKVTGLIPGAAGELYVDTGSYPEVIEADGRVWSESIPELVSNNWTRIRQTTRRNRMWTVAADGAVWYWSSEHEEKLARHDGRQEQEFKMPSYAAPVEVDKLNRVWLASGTLWRMSPEPDFALEIGPATWFMTSNNSRTGQILVRSNEGYVGTIELTLGDLPQGIEGLISPQQLEAGETAVLQLTSENAPLGETTVMILGSSVDFERQGAFRLAVVEDVGEVLLPVVVK